MSISIHISFLGALKVATGVSSQTLQLPDGADVRDAILAAGLKDGVDVWALVDGERVEHDAPLTDGAKLTLFHPAGGG